MYRLIAESGNYSFEITLGLVEGYGSGREHTPGAVIEATMAWVKARMGEGLPYVTTCVSEGTLVYNQVEPAVVLSGMANPVYHKGLPLAGLRDVVFDLATWLSEQFNQARVYVRWLDRVYVFENEACPPAIMGARPRPLTLAQPDPK